MWVLFFCLFFCTLNAERSTFSQMAAKQLISLNNKDLDKNWQLPEYFGHIKVISSKDSPRYAVFIEKMKEVGLTEEQIELSPCISGSALDKSLWSRVPPRIVEDDLKKQGVAGCFYAHYIAIKDTYERYKRAIEHYTALQNEANPSLLKLYLAQAQIDKYSSVLIMEDNNAFGLLLGDGVPTLEGKGRKFRETIAQVPGDWDLFYFVILHGEWGTPRAEFIEGRPDILKAKFGLLTKCFAVNASAYETVVRQFETYLFSPPEQELLPSDFMYALLHEKLHAYIAREPLAYRYNCPSLVGNSDHYEEKHFQPWPHW